MSSLVEHAKRELEIAKIDEAGYDNMLSESVLEIIKIFSTQGHSGGSASVVTSIVEKLMRFEPLAPLTGEDDEWVDIEILDNFFQNRRCSHVFKENGVAYDNQGRVFRDPDGTEWINSDSRVPVTFPYTPTTEIVDRPEETADVRN